MGGTCYVVAQEPFSELSEIESMLQLQVLQKTRLRFDPAELFRKHIVSSIDGIIHVQKRFQSNPKA